MSRLLDALKNLQSEDSAPADPQPKVTPRLAASIRKAVQQETPAAVAPRPAPNLLLRVPAAGPVRSPSSPPVSVAGPVAPPPVITEPVAPAPVAAAPVVPAPVEPPPASQAPVVSVPMATAPAIPAPDPVKLIEVIQASISSIQQETVLQPAALADPAPATPPKPSRPVATAAEAELRGLLASDAHVRPYRDMLAMVQRNVAGRATPTIAIIGLDGQDSTEHVAAALGTLMAEQAGKATLLIEANPVRSLARRYEALQATGLAELLAGRVERAKAILPTSHERLDLLPFGLATPEQASLLPSALSTALQHLRTTYAAAVIDAGPLSSPWAMAASRSVDAAYLVVRVGDTSAEHATGCVERFRAAGGKLTGCIAVGPLPA